MFKSSSHLNSSSFFWQIIELDKKRNTNREALRALKTKDTTGLKSKQGILGQSMKFLLAQTKNPIFTDQNMHTHFLDIYNHP